MNEQNKCGDGPIGPIEPASMTEHLMNDHGMQAYYFWSALSDVAQRTTWFYLEKIHEKPNIILLSRQHMDLYLIYIDSVLTPEKKAIKGHPTFMGMKIICAEVEKSPVFVYDATADLEKKD